MNFLNIGPSELMVILALAVLMIGPKRMVELARTLGRATSKLRKISGEFMAIIQAELKETETGARQLVDGTVAGEAGVQGEMQATGKQAMGTVESLKEEIGLASLQAELQATERATREFLEKVTLEEEEDGDEEEIEFAGAGDTLAEDVQPAPEAKLEGPPDVAATEQAQREQDIEKEEAAAALEANEEAAEEEEEAQPPAELQQATSITALTTSQDEPTETAHGEEAPATAAAETEPEAQSQAVQAQPAPEQALGTQAQFQDAALDAPVSMEPVLESGSEDTDAEEKGPREQDVAPKPASEAAGQPAAEAPGDTAEPVAPAEDAQAPADADTPDEPPLSPEEEARVQEAVARAAGLIGLEQAEEEKADNDDRQE